MKGNSPAQLKVDALAVKLTNYEIIKIEILQIPMEMSTDTQITPDLLERVFRYKLTIRDIRGGAYQSEIIDVLKSTVVQPRTKSPDLRWGVIFYNKEGIRVGALYFDRSGNFGAVDNTPVFFSGTFYRWLESNFSKSFR